MVVIPGMNHVQVADGNITEVNWILKDNELHSEITLDLAHDQIAGIIHKFVNNNPLDELIKYSFDNY